jgi:hypothetical protein
LTLFYIYKLKFFWRDEKVTEKKKHHNDADDEIKSITMTLMTTHIQKLDTIQTDNITHKDQRKNILIADNSY